MSKHILMYQVRTEFEGPYTGAGSFHRFKKGTVVIPTEPVGRVTHFIGRHPADPTRELGQILYRSDVVCIGKLKASRNKREGHYCGIYQKQHGRTHEKDMSLRQAKCSMLLFLRDGGLTLVEMEKLENEGVLFPVDTKEITE